MARRAQQLILPFGQGRFDRTTRDGLVALSILKELLVQVSEVPPVPEIDLEEFTERLREGMKKAIRDSKRDRWQGKK